MFRDHEEGEIVSDVELDDYNILERENNLPPVRLMEQDEIPYDDDDDDDDRPKIPLLPKPASALSKYNVWQIDETEDLSVSFNCTMGQMQLAYGPMNRDVESYSYMSPASLNGRNKRFINMKLFKGEGTRRLAPLSNKTVTDSELAEEIARKLYETNKELIHAAVETLGQKKSVELYRKTRKIEKNGGLLILDKSRKRSSGGVFLFLIHQDKSITEDQIKSIFGEGNNREKIRHKKKKKSKKAKAKENDFTALLMKTRAEIELEKAGRTPPPSPASPAPETSMPNTSSPEMIIS